MASKVNLRFTALLIVIISMVFGATVVVAFVAMKNSGEELIAKGDELMAKGEVEEAIKAYSRAVNKQQMNEEWLRIWIGAMEKYVPSSRQEYRTYYQTQYMSGLAGLARADATGVESRMRLLEELYQRNRQLGTDQAGWQALVHEAEDQLAAAEGIEGAEVLRRYRGLARQAMLESGAQLPDEVVQLTLEDLQVALQVNPSDVDSGVARAAWHDEMAERARLSNLPEAAAEQNAKALGAINEFLATNPDNARARLARVALEMQAFRRSAAKVRPEEFQERFGPMVEEIEGLILQADAASLDPLVVQQLVTHMRISGRDDRVVPLLEHALAGKPADARLRLLLAERLTATDPARAIEELDKVIAQPDLPIGINGLALLYQRDNARETKIMAALLQWEHATDDQGRRAALERAATYRNELAAAVGRDSDRVLLADGRLQFARGELMPARKSLNDYLKTSPNDDNARILLASIMRQQGNLGAARDLLSEVVDRGRVSLPVIAQLAAVCGQLGEYADASRYAQILVDAEPENAQYVAMRDGFQDLLLGGGDDPVKAGLLEARDLLAGVTPDMDAAAAILRQLIADHPTDVRPHAALIETMTLFGRKDEAIAAADAALAAFPDHEGIKRFREALDIANPVEELLARIDESDRPPLEKHLRAHQVLARFGRQEEADDRLRQAAEIDPTNATVVEALFVRALTEGDVEAAEAQASIAERENLDNASGQTYRARILMFKGQYREAIVLLERAIAADPLNAGTHRWLGELRLQLGETTAAMDALRRALELRPTDVAATKALMRAHDIAGNAQQALRLARDAQDRAAHDQDFVEHWLTLETTAAGGDRAEALRIRRSLAERFPENTRNRAQLVRLLMQDGAWDEARTLIDELRAASDTLETLDLHLRWLAAQGQLQEAVEALNAFVETHEEQVKGGRNYLLLADVFQDFGRTDLAIETLRQGREHQDPALPRCDLNLGAMLFQMGRYAEALDAYRAAVATMDPTNDPERVAPKRIVECLSKTGQHEKALASIDEFRLDMRGDATVLLLAADARASLGHSRSDVIDLLNRAVAARPDLAIGYVQRAEYNARFPDLQRDVEADLVQALDVQPNSLLALQRLSEFYQRHGRFTDAIDLFNRAVARDEANESLRIAAANLLAQRQRNDEAIRLLEAGLNVNPESQRLLVLLGNLCKEARRFNDARRHYASLWDATKSTAAAVMLIDAMLSGDNPDLTGATRLLNRPELAVDGDPMLLACRARVGMAQKRPAETVRRDLTAAIAALNQQNPREVGDFLTVLSQFHNGDRELVGTLAAIQPEGGYQFWMALQVATLLTGQPETAEQGVAQLTRISQMNDVPALRLAALRTLGQVHYASKDYPKALEVFLAGAELAPEDGQLLNNVAYVLSAHLDDPARARVYAEQAARLRPTDPNVLDTLGLTYLKLNELSLAEDALNRAVTAAGQNSQRVAAYIHLAELHLKRSRPAEARRYLDLLAEVEATDPGALAPFADDVQGLRARISQG